MNASAKGSRHRSATTRERPTTLRAPGRTSWLIWWLNQ